MYLDHLMLQFLLEVSMYHSIFLLLIIMYMKTMKDLLLL